MLKLPKITDKEILDYIDNEFRNKKEHSKMLGSFAFRNWQEYLNTERRTNQLIKESDIVRFISMLEHEKHRSLRTISNYLGQLVPFFFFHKLRIANYARKKKNIIANKAKEEKKYQPVYSGDLKKIYENTSFKGKVIIRLLLFEKISLKDLATIHVGKEGDQYTLVNQKTTLVLKNKETLEIVKQMAETKEQAINEQFFARLRGLDKFMLSLTKSTLDYQITPLNLRKFGGYVHEKDLTYWLSQMVKK